jgi:hypothetical protein
MSGVRMAVTSAVILLLVISLASGTAVAGAVDGGSGAETETAASSGSTTVTVERDGDRLRYELSVTPAPEVERLWVVVGGASVVASSGFEVTGDEGRTRLRWTGAETATVELVAGGDRESAAAGDGGGQESVVRDRWAFTEVPFVEVQRDSGGSVERSWPLAERTRTESGVHGARYALTGTTESVARSASGRRVEVVAPATEGPRVGSEAAAESIVDAGWRLDVGDGGDDVLAFAVPGVRPGGESVPVHDEFWVNADSRLDSPENVWLHEYVHTRQSFTLTDEMRWFREASAEYYAARLSYEQGRIDRRTMERHLDGSPSEATLTDPSAWRDRTVPRDKGARLLAVLDRKIRAETHGYNSLQDVFWRLNRHDGPVTYEAFARAVSDVAGEPMGEWLDTHVAGDTPVADQYPGTAPFIGAGLPSAENRPVGVTFVVVSFALSLVASPPLYGVLRRLQRRGRPATP